MSQNWRHEKDFGDHEALHSILSVGPICAFKIGLRSGEKFLALLSFDCFLVIFYFSTFSCLLEVEGNRPVYNTPTWTLNLNFSLHMGPLMKV